ncbi:transketolase [Saccharothrix lopnurensis]|uniref:Transketolase n=1 Tax=Saccharothrix lopnurensis TaxID=1670621 RepID=A0ABW1NX00_9PSEU
MKVSPDSSVLTRERPRVSGNADRERLHTLSRKIRATALEMIHIAGSGHIGSSLSSVDIMTVLRFGQMRWRSAVDRDVFVLSKGHAVPAWYATLMVAGDLDPALIGTLRTLDSPLQGHPDRTRCEYVDVSTGALGQGLSVALGRAEAKTLKGASGHVYCLVGDGECQEGQIWEAAMYAGARGVPNLTLIVDGNGRQSDGTVRATMDLMPLSDKLRSFRWSVREVDGHAHQALEKALTLARTDTTGPSAIIAHTHKGHLGPGRTALDGAHSGLFDEVGLRDALRYLESGR